MNRYCKGTKVNLTKLDEIKVNERVQNGRTLVKMSTKSPDNAGERLCLNTTLLSWIENRQSRRDFVCDAFTSLEEKVELRFVHRCVRSAELDLSEEHGEREMIGVQERSRSSFEVVQEEILDEDGESGARVGDAGEGGVVEKDKVEDVEEESERELVEMVEEMEVAKDEEDRAARLREREILSCDLLDLRHDRVGLLDLSSDIRSFSFERFQRFDDPAKRVSLQEHV